MAKILRCNLKTEKDVAVKYEDLQSTPELKVLGWVAGAIFPTDGGEWLLNYRGHLCALDLRRPDSIPHIMKTKEEAIQFVLKNIGWGTWDLFIRKYWSEHFSK